jgi:uncharacterized Zn finger protein
MSAITTIICPNCGNPAAERHNLLERQLSRTECRECDYLSIVCTHTHRVIESYASGIDVGKSRQTMLERNSIGIV